MGHLKQTNIDINTYENNNIKHASNGYISGSNDISDNDVQSDDNKIFNFPMDKIMLFVVVVVLSLSAAFLINGIVHREDDLVETKAINVETENEKTNSAITNIDDYTGVEIAADVCNLRSSPEVTDNIKGTLNRGVRVTITDTNFSTGGTKWLKIETDQGNSGWVSEKVVKYFSDIDIPISEINLAGWFWDGYDETQMVDGYLLSTSRICLEDFDYIEIKYEPTVVESVRLVNGSASESEFFELAKLKKVKFVFDNGDEYDSEYENEFNYLGEVKYFDHASESSSVKIYVDETFNDVGAEHFGIGELFLYSGNFE